MFLLVDLCCLKMVWICNEGSFYELKVVVKVVVKFVLKVVVKVVLKFVVIGCSESCSKSCSNSCSKSCSEIKKGVCFLWGFVLIW